MNAMESLHERPARLLLSTTLLAGTLDLVSALLYAALAGHPPLGVPVGIAMALWPGARTAGLPAVMAGVLLHFAIMLVMVAVFMAAARRWRGLLVRPVVTGTAYGLVLWAVMYLIVLPLRWPQLFPQFGALALFQQLFSHIVLVGLPIAWCARRSFVSLALA